MYGSCTVLILRSSVLSCRHMLPIHYPSFVHQFPMRCTSGSSPSQIRVHQTSTSCNRRELISTGRQTHEVRVKCMSSHNQLGPFLFRSVPTFVHAQNLPPDWSNLTWRGMNFTACHQRTSIQATYANWYERIENRRLRFTSVDAIRQGVTSL